MNKSFIFYESFIVAILNIRSEAVQLAMLRAIINYGLYGVEPEFNDATGVLDGMFTQIRYLIDAAQDKRAKRIANAKKGGAPKGNNNAQEQPKTTKNNQKQPKTTKNNQKQPKTTKNNQKQPYNVNVNVNDNVNSILPSIDGKSNSKADLTQPKSFKDVVLQYFNEKMANKAIKQVRQINNQRSEWLMARVKEYGKDAILEMIDKAAASDFLNGRNGRGFVATFDWLMRPNNFPKVIDGNYDNNNNSNGTTNSNGYIAPELRATQERREQEERLAVRIRQLAEEDGGGM